MFKALCIIYLHQFLEIMKIRSLILIFASALLSSCAMMYNEKAVDLSINSNPPGADIFIEGRNYGRTPSTIQIEPKNYTVTLNKEGYGSAVFNTDYWVTARNKNCVADILGTILLVPFYSFYWSGYCNDFKQKEYFINIPNSGPSVGSAYNPSMLGLGNNPENMINYYYSQDMMNNPYAGKQGY